MKTQYYTAASLDGFIATSDDSLEWLFSLADINATSYLRVHHTGRRVAMAQRPMHGLCATSSSQTRPRLGAGPTNSMGLPSCASAHCRGRHSVCARRCASHPCPYARRRARKNLWLVGVAGWWDSSTTRTARRADHSNWLSHAWGKPLLPRQLTHRLSGWCRSSNTARVSRSYGMKCPCVPRPSWPLPVCGVG